MSTKQWNTTLWAQQDYKIKNFFMGNMALQFPKGKKEHTEKFLKWWFGAIELEMISSQLNFNSHKIKNRISIKLGRMLFDKEFGIFGSNVVKVNSTLKSINYNFKVESIKGNSIT